MPRKKLCFDKSLEENKGSKNGEHLFKMDSPPRQKLKPQKLPWLGNISANGKVTPKDRSEEKPKLKPRKLPELQVIDLAQNGWYKAPTSASTSSHEKNLKDTVKLKPQKLFQCASEESKSTNKSTEKPKLKPRKMPELQDFVPKQNGHLKPQQAFIQTKQSSRESFAGKRTHNDLQSEQIQRKKPKLDQPVVRRNLFKEPAQQNKFKALRKKKSRGSLQKKEPALIVTEASITDDIRPLEITLPTTEQKSNDIEPDMPKSCSPTPSEEFLALESALKTPSSHVNMQTMPRDETINDQEPDQIVEVFCAELDALRNSVRQQLERIMTETDQKLAKLKEDLKSSFRNGNENKENTVVRRSPRLTKIGSPAFSPINADLRKSTLKKNFRKKVLFQDSTPKSEKVKKAEVMYNSLRQNHPLLRTPKFKSEKEETEQRQSLSVVLQQQCLMLQDTPAHK